MAQPEIAYTVADTAALEGVVEALGERFSVESERTLRQRTYFDTFDWRLWRTKGRVWLQPGATGSQLRWQVEGRPRPERLDFGREIEPGEIGFAANLPAGPFRERLARVISMRRLLPIVDVRAEGRLIRVLDGRRKTVVQLLAEVPGARSPGSRKSRESLEPILVVRPVRGYGRAYREVVRFLGGELELGRVAADEFEVGSALNGAGRAGDYTSKPTLVLEAETAADEAMRALLMTLLETLERNEEGTIQGLDTEFLHDFRVAVRRTRSALSLTKRVWPKGSLDSFRQEFSWLGKVTGPARDMDVYLLEFPSSVATLPKSVRGDLEPLRALVQERQSLEQRSVATALRSQRYRRLAESWRSFLAAPPEEASRPEEAREPIARLASRAIGKAHRRVLKRGRAIDEDSPSEALHQLRIDCKKLRYALELFRSLYPPKHVVRLIGALKVLQENLGAFNDYGVQQRMLGELSRDLVTSDPAGSAAVLAAGRLVADLEQREANERARFSKRFAKFSSDKTTARFRRMLALGKRQ